MIEVKDLYEQERKQRMLDNYNELKRNYEKFVKLVEEMHSNPETFNPYDYCVATGQRDFYKQQMEYAEGAEDRRQRDIEIFSKMST